MGPPAMPMLTLTSIGRRTGKPRAVQLAYLEHDGDPLVVASAMGQKKHPAWRYNLDANPVVEVQTRGVRFKARAVVLSDSEKDAVWDDIRRAIPQMNVYVKRTQRNIRVFRLSRSEPASE
jgi:deazaflavin-dependent oxidoreductase (nitroreductase family)